MQEDVIQGLESIEGFNDINDDDCASKDASYSAAASSDIFDIDESLRLKWLRMM